ncbi:MAG: ABC transporter permease subunit [Actinomycetaceae bacterium]|nr:ABC transporter permease [Arcanobacterium sp.]MDD7505843.1 ABC transporter permease subunit [Actinomycetaceae bacterium]MDY6143773.1 ABC transporter permease subunit [Arcanobacterium sp.]
MLKSELYKLFYSRAFTIALSVMVALNAAICWLIARDGTPDLSLIAAPWNVPALFSLSIGAIHVTNEYANNTMRTTVLEAPRRGRVFAAKLVALTLYLTLWIAALMAISAVAILIAAPQADAFVENTALTLIEFLYAIVMIGLMGAGLGFLTRGTAPSIVAGFGILFLSSVLVLIPLDFFETVYPKFLIPNTVNQIVSTSGLPEHLAYSRGVSTLILLAYPIIFCAAGLLRFLKSDV